MALSAVLGVFHYVTESDDRDFVDRLHSYFTTNLLLSLAVIVSFKQFGGRPIECMVPDHFSQSSWEEYAESYCWTQDTYFVEPHTHIEMITKESRLKDRRISYYQWVSFFLLLQAACFRLPSIFWQMFSDYSGVKVLEIIKLANDPNNLDPRIKDTNIKSASSHLQGALRFHQRIRQRQVYPHRILYLFNLPYSSLYVTTVYILSKMFYALNVFFQLLIMNRFLQTEKYTFFGFSALMNILEGKPWEESGMFPRISFCDFQVRIPGNIQNNTIQCVLAINIFNEKVFIFLWFWYLLLFFFATCSFVYWLFVILFQCFNRNFVERHMEMSELDFDPEDDKKNVSRFMKYLGSDGLLVLRIVTLQSGVIFGTELCAQIWRSFFGDFTIKRAKSLPRINDLDERDPEEINSVILHRNINKK